MYSDYEYELGTINYMFSNKFKEKSGINERQIVKKS